MNRIRGFELIKEKDLPGIGLPTRATTNSAGYDIAAAAAVLLNAGQMAIVPTGLKVYMQPDEYLSIHIRSSLAFKHRLYLANGQGIIDADYYNNPDNDGHILIAIINGGEQDFKIEPGMRIAQGIFNKYLLVDQDRTLNKEIRTGGTGSTGY